MYFAQCGELIYRMELLVTGKWETVCSGLFSHKKSLGIGIFQNLPSSLKAKVKSIFGSAKKKIPAKGREKSLSMDILKLGELPLPGKFHRACGAVAVLGNDDLRGVVQSFIIDLGAVEEDNHIRILLNRAALTQVRNHGGVVGALLRATVQLREEEYGYIQFPGQQLHGTGHVRYFLLTVVILAGGGSTACSIHKLHVVNNHHVQPVLRL